LGIGGDRGELPRFLNPKENSFPSLEGYDSFLALTSMQPYWPMMEQPYQWGRPIATLRWGMMLRDNVVMLVTTMVKVGDKSQLDVGEGSSEPSSKGQPTGPSHSIKSCEQIS
jgi:hypothetical protein